MDRAGNRGATFGLEDAVGRNAVNSFPGGHSSRCFTYVKRSVEKKARRHLARARTRRGFGWNRWSSRIYRTLTAWFRRRLPPGAYVRIELEVNQKHVGRAARHWPALREVIVESLRRALASRCAGISA